MSVPPLADRSASRPPAAGSGALPQAWSALAPDVKRERIIEAAIAVFSRRGLEAPMHEVAAAAGAGVASIYRVFPSKHDLWAAIVIRRLQEMTAAFERACEQPGPRWDALVEVLARHVTHQSPEPFFTEARAVVEDRPEVAAAHTHCVAAQARLLDAARAEGRLRADATPEDLKLLFAATRAARRHDPDSVPRMLELMLDALETRDSAAAGRISAGAH
ncbi:MAG TPA: TetR/AcrR family transcriptional regulator [Solirubrobacteraceae bacterium]|nr:TetR/AcrR family transcriptional regulator [Solirubrobacteraceae bacterium]